MTKIWVLLLALLAGTAEAVTDTFNASGTWTAPAGVTSVTVETWAGGGAGGGATGNPAKGGGGAGGQYAKKMVAVVPGNIYAVVVGAGGAGGTANGGVGGDSTFAGTLVVAKGGAGGTGAVNGIGGLGSTVGGVGDIVYAGGNGADSTAATRCNTGGSGGGGAGSTGAGGNAAGNTGGAGTAIGGGAGGSATNGSGNGAAGAVAGGGGAGACAENNTDRSGGAGAAGRVDITYTPPPVVSSINCAGACTTSAASASWTVVFDQSVSGVNSGNFALVNTGLGGAPAITSVTGSGTTWTVTASTGTGTGTLGLNMVNTTGVSPAIINLPFTGQVYSVRPPTPVNYYHDTTAGVNIGFDGTTNVTSGTNQTIPPIITASLTTANTCTGNARSANHPTGLYTHSRWYLNTSYAVATNIGANPSGSARLRGQAATNTVIVSLYDYDPASGAKVLIGSSPAITLTGGGTTTTYPYTISSPVYTVPAGHRLMLEYNFNQPVATNNARVYCSATSAYIAVTETAAMAVSSINLADPSPTSAASVSWVVTFNTAITGLSSSNFALVNSGLGGTPAITSVTGSGTAWTVTASTGTGSGTLGLDMVNSAGVTPAITNLPFTGEIYTIDRFTCDPPTGIPGLPAMTCVCDNFGRASLNPSTIFGQDWIVGYSGGTFGNPRIVNPGYLRLTDNSGGAATVANVPSAFPAAGNLIIVEFKHYAYNGTGADGIALTLSDALLAPTPGAFGGSLGYAQKSNPGSDCTVPGGCPGFNGGWVGIAVDEYGNFSNNTEGRTGGLAPGLTLDSVAVRGSGSGQIGYPYLAGSATLTPGIDNAASLTPAYGHAYRIMVDARNYTWNGSTGNKVTQVSVDRDTTGTGASYAPVVPSFDAYVAYASQADVPANWKLSFTGSTGGANNIHEISGLKICAQAITPPAGYLIQVDNLSPSTCGTPGGNPDAAPVVTVKAVDSNGNVIANYTGIVNLAAMLSGGAASAAVWSLASGNGTLVGNQYTFTATDLGVAQFYLTDPSSQDVYLTVTESGGSPSTSLATPIQYRGGTFTVATVNDALGDGVVAGRPHRMSVTRTNCGTGIDTAYVGTKPLDGWYDPAAEHPGGVAPQICNLNGGNSCLPAAGSICSILSMGEPLPPSAGSNNLSLSFDLGVAHFCLVTGDVGKYSIGLRDDSNVASPIRGSIALTARPFAVVVSDVKQGATNNPAINTPGGGIFAKAGTAFQATVAGYLWSSAGDTGGDGLPGAVADWSAVTAGGIAPHYADTVALAAGAPFAPAAGVVGALGNGSVAVSSGSTTATTLNYSEVGSFTLTATPATNYLNAGINLGDRVAIFSNPANPARNGWVGRFIPDHFDTAVVLSGGVPMPCPVGLVCPVSNGVQNGFVYSGQPFSVQVIARNLAGATTANYDGAMGYAKTVALSAWNAAGGATPNPSGLPLANNTIAADAFGAGVATTATPAYTLAAVLTAPTNIFLRAEDNTDNVTSLRAVPAASVEGGVMVASGRVRISSAHGSELLPLPMAATVQYWNGAWVASVSDTATTIGAADFALAFPAGTASRPNNLAACETALSIAGISPNFRVNLSAPGNGNNGWTDLTLNLGATAAGSQCIAVGGVGAASTTANRPWLQFPWVGGAATNPTARATFGVHKGNNEFIYLREVY